MELDTLLGPSTRVSKNVVTTALPGIVILNPYSSFRGFLKTI
jgi:hypothetical protein